MKKMSLFLFCFFFMLQASADISKALKLKEQGELAQAHELLTNIIVDNPQNADALNALGVIDYRQSNFAQAQNNFQQASRWALTDDIKEEALYNLSRVQAELKDYEASLKNLDAVLSLNDKNLEAQNNREVVVMLLEVQKEQEQEEQDHEKNDENKDEKEKDKDKEKSSEKDSEQKVVREEDVYKKSDDGDYCEQGDTDESEGESEKTQGNEEQDGQSSGDETDGASGQGSEDGGQHGYSKKEGLKEQEGLKEGEDQGANDEDGSQKENQPGSQQPEQPESNDEGQAQKEKSDAEGGSEDVASKPENEGQDIDKGEQSYSKKAQPGDQDHQTSLGETENVLVEEDTIAEDLLQNVYDISQDERLTENQKEMISYIEQAEVKTRKNMISQMLKGMPKPGGGRTW